MTNITQCDNCGRHQTSEHNHEVRSFPANCAGVTEGDIAVCDRCHTCMEGRSGSLAEILSSDSDKKLIVAGAGTGKTYTFKKLLENMPVDSSAVVFTLINNLAVDLQRDLSGLGSDNIRASTFHAYCRSLLHSQIKTDDLSGNFEYFPDLPEIVADDVALLNLEFSKDDFHESFATQTKDEVREFYLVRAGYYDAVSHDDSVYRVFKYFDENREEIPVYGLVIADEYQDFNALEAAFIDLLSSKNKVVVAGDDDQALYAFRHASTEYIRRLYEDDEYTKFSLPYSSRCTSTLIDSANHFVDQIKAEGLLGDRIPRAHESYWPDKYFYDAQYPTISIANCTQPRTAWEFIRSRIVELSDAEGLDGTESDLPFLIIHTEQYRLRQIRECLIDHLDLSRFAIDDSSSQTEFTIEDGYDLIKKGKLNLGWRMVTYHDRPSDLASIIESIHNEDHSLPDLLTEDYKNKHLALMEKELDDEDPDSEADIDEVPKIRIKIVNLFGSKGLSALHTIIAGVNKETFPADDRDIKEDEACKFIVSLTRAKRSCAIVSYKRYDTRRSVLVGGPSKFIAMLPAEKLEIHNYRIQGGRLHAD